MDKDKKQENFEQAIASLKEMLRTMNYGSITLIVQDNIIVQMEKNEKIRLK
ncbi:MULTISPECIES: YezD family protein [Lysinibacillus]|uniref:DUF2292 domain-containing protein n=1 Tax=Lysinibacillus antri TaxID=2498145 RepID=A0A3S0PA70_9BACI|nr:MULTISPECIES: YezD family protein [Lysinibacillus]RUL56536.1 DUF2292 domain-containing protein [Lysinibacillus antri]TSI03052.1 DUF2292 domain-containing protein [Lysinibacillus sp. BW-2-10]